jgi:energy-coupling factor transporter ATP-binding protein EcfA2
MLTFMQAVWPTTGNYLVAHPFPNGGFNQVAFDNIEAATKQAEMWSKQGRDAYFAVGTVTSLGSNASRKGVDVKEFRAFILDIDCGEGKDYTTQPEAVKALKDTVSKLDLPKPTVVNSGYGWHCYWMLTEPIAADQWQTIAQRFKAVVAHVGLRADPSRTADRASVLRVPDTINYKRDSQAKVEVLKWSDPCTVEEFSAAVNNYFEFNNLQEPKPKVHQSSEDVKLLEAFGIDANTGEAYKPANFEAIVEGCQTMRYCVDNNEKLSEPLWRCALSIAKFCEGADEHIHTVSENHPDYSASATEAKAEGINKPFTCDQFRQNCTTCNGCEQQRNSPISIGTTLLQTVGSYQVSPTISIMPASHSEDDDTDSVPSGYSIGGFVADYPVGYTLNFGGITAQIKSADDDFKTKRLTICPYPVKFVRRVHDFALGEDIAHFQLMLPKDGWRDVAVKLRDISDPKGGKVCTILSGMGCIVSANDQKHMGEFMSAYLRQVIAAAAASKNYSQLGWADEGELFVLQDKSIKSDGTIIDSGMSSAITSLTNALTKRGTLEAWKDIVNTYSVDGYEAYAFGHSVAYGSLLFRYTGFKGAIVALLGDTGSGKSTILKTINTVFGHPDDLMLQQDDTVNARMKQIAVMNSLSPTYDEVSNIEPSELSDFCYAISQGRDKRRLTQGGAMSGAELRWCSITVTSANHSIYERLGMLKSDASAEAMRVFEYHVKTTMHALNKNEAEKIFEGLDRNYGHAGEIFVSWLMQNQEFADERVKYWRNRFDSEAKVPTKERYWSSIVGATLAGAELSAKLSLNKFDVEKLFKFAVSQVGAARTAVGDNKQSPTALLVDYLNQSIRSTIVLGGGTVEKGKDTSVWVKQEPSNGLVVRIEIDRNLAYISRAAIKKWVTDGGGDYTSMRTDLTQRKIIINDSVDKVLSGGSQVMKSGQTTCWLIDLNHTSMSGGVQLQVVKMAEKSGEKVVAEGKPF